MCGVHPYLVDACESMCDTHRISYVKDISILFDCESIVIYVVESDTEHTRGDEGSEQVYVQKLTVSAQGISSDVPETNKHVASRAPEQSSSRTQFLRLCSLVDGIGLCNSHTSCRVSSIDRCLEQDMFV